MGADAPLALLYNTVLVVAAGSHLPVEISAGNFVVTLERSHLLATLRVFDSDSAFVHADNDILLTFLDPIDNHEEEQHANEAVDDLDGQ